MEIINVKAADGGRKTELTIEMTAEEAEQFKKALASGKLAHLGLNEHSDVQIRQSHEGTAKWAGSEHEKRAKPKGNRPDPTRIA